jgi:hypothetical protein
VLPDPADVTQIATWSDEHERRAQTSRSSKAQNFAPGHGNSAGNTQIE